MCLKLEFNQGYTTMHGQPTIKICYAKQAIQIHQYKKIKIKLYKNNAAIWYNKNTQDSHLQTVTIPEAAYIQLRRRPPEDEQGNARNM